MEIKLGMFRLPFKTREEVNLAYMLEEQRKFYFSKNSPFGVGINDIKPDMDKMKTYLINKAIKDNADINKNKKEN